MTDGTPCFECGKPATEHHHVVPRSLGGTRTVPLCCGCHDMAHDMRRHHGRGGLTARALQAKRTRGERVGAVRYGYRLAPDGRTEIEDEDEQAVITEARRLRAEGLSLRRVADELARIGMRTRNGRRFEHHSIARMVND
jgi:pyridoxal biosynthesis lyase PdxS